MKRLIAMSLVAFDPDGAECDAPAVLMTRLPGHLDLEPRNLEPWLRQMAELLPPIHAVRPGPFSVQGWQIWDDLRAMSPPTWSARKRDWEDLIENVRGPWPDHEPRFVHRDFQQYNVLWARGRPTGVLDWINASMGPVELDFGHFRHNLLGDFGFEVAERFHRCPHIEPKPHHCWEALNFAPTAPRTETERVAFDSYVSSLLAKLR